eukprot:CAMPEP_0185809816 /NCGR_PEP_ID=MMETSP1322-20130828/6421_1 /TAXON_ID=265543 /ORGANISM="Minutocellus polymorphus, Strain RCC2270" /LENGTH=70 /DNA_ID=CAMNT_0028506107 /DNA_START=54 /DNA_END=263 /DNA_ORIENTATION=+
MISPVKILHAGIVCGQAVPLYSGSEVVDDAVEEAAVAVEVSSFASSSSFSRFVAFSFFVPVFLAAKYLLI